MLAGLLTGISAAVPSSPAEAITGNDFDPGLIITDEIFHASGSMTDQQIQAFLESKVPNCASGYTCLKSYRVDTTAGRPDAPGKCAPYVGAADELASTIIGKVSRACGINPQVLIVLLQKEQGLITATAPSAQKYRAATGYGCPDTSVCDSKYYGLFNQLYSAAWQFKTYEVSTTGSFDRFDPGAVRTIGYHPNANCGTRPVYIVNQATANLYYYTPYTPNVSALANLSGTGDACASYGNRNFWVYFTNWFGSPSGPRNLHGAFDSAAGVVGGIQVTGWSVDPYSTLPSSYVWVNVDGSGGPVFADKPLDWIHALYPNAGPNHGFSAVVPASPGTHTVCVQGTSSALLGCKTVVVPRTAEGSFDTAVGVAGGVRVAGWTLDRTSTESSYGWVTVDGVGTTIYANLPMDWIDGYIPGVGPNHGFDVVVPASVGTHTVCVSGFQAIQLGCKTVTVPVSAQGGFDAATGVPGGVRVTGWTVDSTSASSVFGWVNVDGSGMPVLASQPLNWINNHIPGVGPNHGIDVTIPATPGKHTVCLFGYQSIQLGCKTVTVPISAQGGFDAAVGVSGGIRVTGWTADSTSAQSVYGWINVDGSGMPVYANVSLNWIDAHLPGVGPFHGIDTVIPASRGRHTVCLFGYQSISLGCKVVTVP